MKRNVIPGEDKSGPRNVIPVVLVVQMVPMISMGPVLVNIMDV